MVPRQPEPALERGYIAAVLAKGVDPDDELAELQELARTALVEPIGELVQHRPRPEGRTYLGKGKVEELKRAYRESGAEVLLVDGELDPAQQRTLEDVLQARVVDRTQLILDIFAQHAVSAEGKLQVELAQLEYNLARMRGLWSHLERLGGGIGTRGPGETQIETDRRLARNRIATLKRRLEHVKGTRAVQRAERERAALPTVALVGYTNAGKSTLINALTGAEVGVADRLFHTLDPATRTLRIGGRPHLLTDTVGFISKLPHELVDAFSATLEETRRADLLAHVLDGSAPDEHGERMRRAVEQTLEEIDAGARPRLLIVNKIDLLDRERVEELRLHHPRAVLVSAATGEGLEELRERIEVELRHTLRPLDLLVPYADGRRLAELHELAGEISRQDTPEGVRVRALVPAALAERFSRFAVVT